MHSPVLKRPPRRAGWSGRVATALRFGVVIASGSVLALPVWTAVSRWDALPLDVVWRSVWSATVAAVISTTVAIAIASHRPLRQRSMTHGGILNRLFGWAVDVPIALPPVVLGFALLAFVRGPLAGLDNELSITATAAAVVIAQVAATLPLACRLAESTLAAAQSNAFAVLATGGAGPGSLAVNRVRESAPSLAAVAVLTWALAFATFGPVLVFAGATAGRTEVLPTAIYLHIAAGELAVASRLSAVMILVAVVVTAAARRWTYRNG